MFRIEENKKVRYFHVCDSRKPGIGIWDSFPVIGSVVERLKHQNARYNLKCSFML